MISHLLCFGGKTNQKGDNVAEQSTIDDLNLQVKQLKEENERLKEALQEKTLELENNSRLIAAGDSAGMVVHEALNPITAIISRLQHALDEESDLQLMALILSEWANDFEEGGVDQLMTMLKKPTDDGILLVEEDLKNVLKGIQRNNRDLEFSIKQLKRVVLILNSLRGLVRLESSLEPHNVNDSITMTKELMEISLQKLNIEFKQEINHHSNVMVDENEFIQVLHNLVRNAKQAIQKNGCITIKTKEKDGHLEIRVCDTGPGIPPELKGKIFLNRFTTKDKRSGTGLGLSFSKRIMQKFGGDLTLESSGGDSQGATFLCSLPIKS